MTFPSTTIEIYESWANYGPVWRFRVIARNGKIISSGQAYTRKSDAIRGARRAYPGARIVVN
jgi:uncharacterized protein YegP (UPF0339 family)